MTSFRALSLPTISAAAKRYRTLICSHELSTQSVKTELGGTLKIDATKLRSPVAISITSKWQELAQFDISKNLSHELLVEQNDEHIIKLVLEDTDAPKEEVEQVSILVPEVFNLVVYGGMDMNLKTSNKLMGSFYASCITGSISLDKIKGPDICVYSERGSVEIRKVIEGNTSITCDTLNAKMINGDAVHLHIHSDATIESMYGKKSIIQTGGNLQLQAFRGMLQCTTINGTTIVNGFDGCLELMAHTGDVQVQLNSIHNFPADFHQLQSTHPSSTTTSSAVTSDTSTEEEDSKPSTIIAQSGKILCIVDPEMSTWLSAETMVAKKSAITIHSKNFDYHSTEPEGHVIGMLTRQPQAPTNTQSTKSSSSGKIDLHGAAKAFGNSFKESSGAFDAWNQQDSSSQETTAATRTQSISSSNHAEEEDTMLSLYAAKEIEIMTKSWIERIHNKYGFSTLTSPDTDTKDHQ